MVSWRKMKPFRAHYSHFQVVYIKLYKKVSQSCADGTLKREIGQAICYEENCVDKCTTFGDPTLNFLIDKHK